MAELFTATETSPIEAEKIKLHLEKIREAQSKDGDLYSAISTAIEELNKFFLNYGKPSFTRNKLMRNDIARSEDYNENLETLSNDLDNLYSMLDQSADVTVEAFNFATISAQEIVNSAGIAASKVLDLNIIKNFVKGQVIVAGDDFLNEKKIDKSAGTATSQAEILRGASAVSLATAGAELVSNDNTTISITPFLPVGGGDAVNTTPTPENLQRFYEGMYYAPIGEQRPAGGSIQFKYVLDPVDLNNIVGTTSTTTVDGKETESVGGGSAAAASAFETQQGFYSVIPVPEAELEDSRRKMVDGNPSTYWECEYVYEVPQLIDLEAEQEEAESDEESTFVTIDYKTAENAALSQDKSGQDLGIHIDYDFQSPTALNFVIVDPVLFSSSTFVEVIDISTASDEEGFETVEGFHDQSFDKILTPEANKVVSEEVAKKTLAPSAFSYQGLGVFTFPVRISSKIRVSLLMRDPTPAVYERLHLITQETTSVTTTVVTKKKKKGLF
jgi:hypothetical protein